MQREAWGMGGGAIHVVAVQTLSLRYVVSLSWRCPPVTMGSLACLHVVHVNLFFFFQMKTLSAA